MAGEALTGGTGPRRRVLFGLLDADSWSWASVKAFLWFLLIIVMLGYIPDRAYYFTVFPTIDIGLLGWSPVNLCPPSNKTLPCPAPAGAILPWEPSPVELALPEPRTGGTAVVAGTKLVYIGGAASEDGEATTSVYVSTLYPNGNFSEWSVGPALPAGVRSAAAAFVAGNVVVLGGTDAAGAPTTDAWVLPIDGATGELGDWQSAAEAGLPIDLPAPRSGAALAVAGDGVFLVGGEDGAGPVASVWKSTFDADGAMTEWVPQAELVRPQAHATAALIGDHLWVYGGSDANGPVGAVQRGDLVPEGEEGAGGIARFGISDEVNLPEARTGAAGFTANGVLYLVGGADGSGPENELYWTTPSAEGEIAGWQTLPATDLPESGLVGATAVVNGSEAFLIGGTTAERTVASAACANLAPQPPFFQLGILGATIPALKLEGEIGQQIGYLNAAGVGTINFIILIVIGWAVAHPARARELLGRLRRRG
ncbi:MAG: hypothetical protein RL338_1823 [Chloroflexota bacterium]